MADQKGIISGNPADFSTVARGGATVVRVVGCGALAPFCAAQELGTYYGTRAGIAVAQTARVEAAALGANGESFLDDIGENGALLLGAAVRPLNQVADISLYISIAVIVVCAVVLVLVGVAVWKL